MLQQQVGHYGFLRRVESAQFASASTSRVDSTGSRYFGEATAQHITDQCGQLACPPQCHKPRKPHQRDTCSPSEVKLSIARCQVKMLQVNESIYIPSDTQHRFENPGQIDLELIEVQTGSVYKDDIVRTEDDYHLHREIRK